MAQKVKQEGTQAKFQTCYPNISGSLNAGKLVRQMINMPTWRGITVKTRLNVLVFTKENLDIFS